MAATTRMNSFPERAIRVFVGAVLVYAGGIKAIDPAQFFTAVQNYHLIPPLAAAAVAFYLPSLEVCCEAALIFRRLYLGAITTTMVMTATFIFCAGFSETAWATRGLRLFRRGTSFGIQGADCLTSL
jgi:Methylamine utilisation protein MauE